MLTTTRTALIAAVAVLTASLFAAPTMAKDAESSAQRPVHLALGDSWAAGVGATNPDEGGYVPLLTQDLRALYDCRPVELPSTPAPPCKRLELRNLSVGGATTGTLIAGQLPEAVELLSERNGDRRPVNDVEVTTMTIGGNDVFRPVVDACSGGVTPQCLQTLAQVFGSYRANLDQILGSLREAGGEGVNIVVTAYDNPLPTCELGPALGPLAAVVLEGDPNLGLLGLNDITRDVAADFGADVAETFGDLSDEDWVGGSDCLHPDDSGYEKVKDAFLEALGP